MNKQLITNQLVPFGLAEVEAKIYLHLLENGAKTPLELSREANINRSKIYRHAEALKAKKLLEETSGSHGKKLTAASPTNLELLLQEKRGELELQKEALPALLKELNSLPTNLQNTFDIKHYHGPEGLKQMLWNQLSANKKVLLYGYQTRNEIVGRVFADKLREEQIRRRITVYEIENEVDPGDYQYTKVVNWSKYYVPRYVPEKILKIRQYTAIFNHTVSIMNWLDDQQVGIEIINSRYAQMQSQLFWGTWEKIGVAPKQPKLHQAS